MIILFTYLMLFILFVILSFLKFKHWINISSVFSCIWCFFGAISWFGFYGLRRPDYIIHVYVYIFVVTVNLTIFTLIKDKYIARRNISYGPIHDSRFVYVQFIGVLLLIPVIMRIIPLMIITKDLGYVRTYYFSGDLFNSYIYDFLFRSVPVSLLTSLIIVYTMYSFITKSFKYLLYAVLNALLITVVNGGGRYAILSLFYSIFLMLITNNFGNKKYYFIRKYKARIIKSVIFIILLLFLITLLRGQNSLFRSIVIYFSGSLSFLDYIISLPNSFALNEHLYGYFTFGILIEPLVLVLKVLGFTDIKVPSYLFNIYCQPFYNIGINGTYISFNANTSILYYFLRDFGVVGIVIGGTLLGSIISLAFNSWRRGNMFGGLVFIYFSIVLFNSIMTFQSFGSGPFIILFSFYFMTQKAFVLKKRKNYGYQL